MAACRLHTEFNYQMGDTKSALSSQELADRAPPLLSAREILKIAQSTEFTEVCGRSAAPRGSGAVPGQPWSRVSPWPCSLAWRTHSCLLLPKYGGSCRGTFKGKILRVTLLLSNSCFVCREGSWLRALSLIPFMMLP